MNVFRLVPIGVCLVSVVGLPATASAQAARPERPYRGLFASGGGGAQQSLIANASIGGGYDDNILLDLPGASGGLDPRNGKSGNLGSLNSSLSYSLNKDRGSFGASAGASTRYYPGQGQPFVGAYSGNAGGSVKLGARTSLSLGQSVTYQPYTFTSLFPSLFDQVPGQLEDQALDLATGRDAYLMYDANAGFGHTFSRRVSFNAGYNFTQSQTAFSQQDPRAGGGSFSRQGGNAGFQIGLSRGLGLRLGYGYQEGRFSASTLRARTHNADVGVNFSRALSFSRRTTLSFGTGTTAFTSGTSTTYQAIGNARLNHEMGRTWNASASYDRSFQFVDTLAVPVFFDSFNVGVGGLVNRRVEVQSGLRAAFGTFGFGNTANRGDFDTLQATAGVTVALNRFMQAGTNYSFFHYRFDQGAILPPGVARNIDRRSVRAQLTFWAPLINRARR